MKIEPLVDVNFEQWLLEQRLEIVCWQQKDGSWVASLTDVLHKVEHCMGDSWYSVWSVPRRTPILATRHLRDLMTSYSGVCISSGRWYWPNKWVDLSRVRFV